MKILDRYVLQKFLLPFIYCFFGFIAIWFIFDLSDNLQDFLQGNAGLPILLKYYNSQIPQIALISIPFGQLLALLYCLTALSRSNEIISMIGAGLSVNRILVPLFAIGFVLVGVCTYFNYENAPHAAMIKKQMLKEIKRGRALESGLTGHLYRNREDNRTWFIRKVFVTDQRLVDIQVIQQDKDGNIMKQWYAREAKFDPAGNTWHLDRAKYVEMDLAGNITHSEMKGDILITDWSESPWRIASSVMNPDFLSVPELEDYLVFNKDFPQKRLAPYRTHLQNRWSLPLASLVVVFLAAPLGIVYSRRGILGGVALAIGLFVLYFLTSILFIELGKGSRLSPFTAAWAPPIFFTIVGCWLLWYRSTNRDLPKIKLPWMS